MYISLRFKTQALNQSYQFRKPSFREGYGIRVMVKVYRTAENHVFQDKATLAHDILETPVLFGPHDGGSAISAFSQKSHKHMAEFV